MKLVHLSELSGDKQKELLNSIDTVMSDCDGVLWRENELIPGADQVINTLKTLGKRIFFVTNNSSKTQEQLLVKLRKLGVNAEPSEVIGTAFLTAQYVKKHMQPGKRVYIIGSSSIADELKLAGIDSFGVGPDVQSDVDLQSQLEALKLDPSVGAVVIGFDPHISYPKLLKAACYLHNPDTLFVAANMDESIQVGPHFQTPSVGAIVAAVRADARREPVLIGKPSKVIGNFLMDSQGLNPERTLMIGDRGDTDMRLGYNNGFKTLLVLTGDTRLENALAWSKSEEEEFYSRAGDYYLPALRDLLPMLNS